MSQCDLLSERYHLPTYGTTPLKIEDFQPEACLAPMPPGLVFIECACGFSIDMLKQRAGPWLVEPPQESNEQARASTDLSRSKSAQSGASTTH